MSRTSLPVRHTLRPRVRQAGVGLIEVLVAVLVLSVAFLGVAALQARSLATSTAELPSHIWLALPAVMTPPGDIGSSLPSASIEESKRTPSS